MTEERNYFAPEITASLEEDDEERVYEDDAEQMEQEDDEEYERTIAITIEGASLYMDTVQILTDLRAQRDRIDQAIAALEALNGTAATKSAKPAPGTKQTAKKRVFSPESRQRMAEAQQRRWSKKRRAVKAAAKKVAAPTPGATKSVKVAAPAPKGARKPMSPATKKKLAAAAKARWAAKKAPAKKAAKKAVAPGATADVKEAQKA